MFHGSGGTVLCLKYFLLLSIPESASNVRNSSKQRVCFLRISFIISTCSLKNSLTPNYNKKKISFVNYRILYISFVLCCETCYMTGVTSGAGTAYPSGAPEFTPIFGGVCAAWSLVFCVAFCSLSFFPFSSLVGVKHHETNQPFSSGQCVICPSSIYGFWLPLW